MPYTDSIKTGTVVREILSIDRDNTYDGLDLTTKFSDEIQTAGDAWAWVKSRITAGNFVGIHVGDYIPFAADGNTMNAQIAGINTYKGAGSPEIGNHIDFITKELWPTAKAVNTAAYNNGVMPTETLTGDGTTTVFTLTKQMTEVTSVALSGGATFTDWTYDNTTFTLTFESAPSGIMTVTGTGSECPWLASDLYLWLNSLAGQIPSGAAVNPGITHVDYTAGGVYSKLPAALKAVIVEKRYALQKRYGATLQGGNTGSSWSLIGKLWLPSEREVSGAPVWAGNGYTSWGDIQYPLFANNAHRVKKSGTARQYWWTIVPKDGSTDNWCVVTGNGNMGFSGVSGACRVPVCFRIA